MTSPRHSLPDSDDSRAGDALDAEAGRIFDDYLAGLEAGRPIRRACWPPTRTWPTGWKRAWQ